MAAAQRKPKWKRRAEARPDEILDAALDEFVENGFDAARVEDVARRAGISKAGLYLYFMSKEELLRALIEREIAPIARKAHQLADEGVDDPLGTIGALVAAVTTVLSNPRVFAVPRIVLAVSARFPEIGAYYRENVIDEALAAMMTLHRAGVEQGVFRDCDSQAAARMIIGPMMMQMILRHVFQAEPDSLSPAERARAHLDLLLKGLGAEAA